MSSVAFRSPAKSLTFSGLVENPSVGKKLKSEQPSMPLFFKGQKESLGTLVWAE